MTYEDGTDSVPKRQHKKFRSQGITQKKEYNNILPITYTLTISIFITSVLLLFYPCKSYCAAFLYSCIMLYLLCHSCLHDVLILTCFIFNCQLKDAGFAKRNIYMYIIYKSAMSNNSWYGNLMFPKNKLISFIYFINQWKTEPKIPQLIHIEEGCRITD
jgi:hypothetical protein